MAVNYCSNGQWWLSIRVVFASGGGQYSTLMPVIVTADGKLPPGVHRVQANIPYQSMAK